MSVAQDYKPEGSILSFPSKLPLHLHQMTFTWPAYAWRVVAPKPKEHHYDPLQIVSLKLIQAGCSDVTQIAELTGMDKKLIEMMMTGLEANELVDSRLQLTDNGQKLLRSELDEEELTEDTRVGWIFTCRISGDVLPLFQTGELPYARSGRMKEIFQHLPPSASYIREIKPPEPLYVLDAIKRHARLIKLTEVMHSSEQAEYDYTIKEESDYDWRATEEDQESRAIGADVSFLQATTKVTILPALPEPVSLIFQMYSTPSFPVEPQVQSPFGLAGGLRFRKVLERYCREREDIEHVFPSFIEESVRLYKDRNQNSTDSETVKNIAEHEVQLQLGASIEHYLEPVHRNLVAMEVERIQMINGFDSFGNFVLRSQRALEGLFLLEIQSLKISRRHLPSSLPNDKQLRIEFVQQHAERLGAESVPICFGTPQPGAIYSAVGSGKVSLAPRVTALLLHGSMTGDASHPMAKLLKKDSLILEKIANVSDVRNKEAHEGIEQTHLDMTQDEQQALARTIADQVYHIVKLKLFDTSEDN